MKTAGAMRSGFVALLAFQLVGSLGELMVCATTPLDHQPIRCANNQQVLMTALVQGHQRVQLMVGRPQGQEQWPMTWPQGAPKVQPVLPHP